MEQGDLEAARRQLEETIARQKGSARAPGRRPQTFRTPRWILPYPGHADVAICEVEVASVERASCAVAFGKPSALQYFKDSGWWN